VTELVHENDQAEQHHPRQDPIPEQRQLLSRKEDLLQANSVLRERQASLTIISDDQLY
jgi:hypothetical protein